MIEIITTVGNEEKAREIATSLVEKKLVACAQIEKIFSIYHWEGKLQNEEEYRVTLKTMKEKYSTVEKYLLDVHLYDLPQIISFEVNNSYKEYNSWVKGECCEKNCIH